MAHGVGCIGSASREPDMREARNAPDDRSHTAEKRLSIGEPNTSTGRTIMIGTGTRFIASTGPIVGCLLMAIAATAQPADEFYRGKQIRIVVGSAAGGGYDA